MDKAAGLIKQYQAVLGRLGEIEKLTVRLDIQLRETIKQLEKIEDKDHEFKKELRQSIIGSVIDYAEQLKREMQDV